MALAAATFQRDRTYPLRLNNRESKIVDTIEKRHTRFVSSASVAFGDLTDATEFSTTLVIPSGALILRAYAEVTQTFAGDGDDSSTLAVTLESANDLQAAIAISDGTNPWDAGLNELAGPPLNAIRTTAERTATVRLNIIATDTALSAGAMKLHVEYALD